MRGKKALWLSILIAISLITSAFTFTNVKADPTRVYVDPASIVNTGLTPVAKTTLKPNGDAMWNMWKKHPAGTGWDKWDDSPGHDGDSTYLYADSYPALQASDLEDLGSVSWDIAKVKVTIFARSNVTTDDMVVPSLFISNIKYEGNAYTVTNESYTMCTSEWGKNPNTDAYWIWSDIDALEAGAIVLKGGDPAVWDAGMEIRVTQLYVEVSGPRFTVDIRVEDVTNLRAFQFAMSFNPDVVEGVWKDPQRAAEIGPFLGSDGGDVYEAPGLGWNNTIGKLWLAGATIYEDDPAKCPDGNGILATVIFLVVHKGETELRLDEETELIDSNGDPISAVIEDGYFRNVAEVAIPTASFTITPVDTPVPLEGYNTTFTSTSTGGTTPYTYKWYLWKTFRRQLEALVTSSGTVTRNYTVRGTYNVSLTIIDNVDVVGTYTGYVTIKAHDVFFTGIETNATMGQYPAQNATDIGEIVKVDVKAINEGDFAEAFDVSCFWAAFYLNEWHYGLIGVGTMNNINLAAGASTTLTFYWDTEGRNLTHPDRFAIHANASAVQYEFDKEREVGKIVDNEFISPPIRIRTHDIRVKEITTAENVRLGEVLEVEVTVVNDGDYNETSISVTLYYASTPIDTKVIDYMENRSYCESMHTLTWKKVLTYDWNTTGLTPDYYTVKIIATSVPSEIDTSDNTLIDGAVYVVIPGDIDRDGDVDPEDFASFAGAYGTSPPSNPECDLDGDGDVDPEDFATFAGKYGTSV